MLRSMALAFPSPLWLGTVRVCDGPTSHQWKGVCVSICECGGYRHPFRLAALSLKDHPLQLPVQRNCEQLAVQVSLADCRGPCMLSLSLVTKVGRENSSPSLTWAACCTGRSGQQPRDGELLDPRLPLPPSALTGPDAEGSLRLETSSSSGSCRVPAALGNTRFLPVRYGFIFTGFRHRRTNKAGMGFHISMRPNALGP